MLIISFSAYLFMITSVNSQTNDASQNSHNQNIEFFADRDVINKGEQVNLKVWVKSQEMNSAIITVFYADKYLQPLEPKPKQKGIVWQDVDLSQKSLVNFSFTGVSTGKYNLYIEVVGTNKKNQKIPPTRLQLKGLEVKESESFVWKLLSNSLVGVFLGAILTFFFTLFNDYREQNKAKVKRQKLIISNLIAHLEANLLAVKNREKTRHTELMNLFLKEGYYTEIQNFLRQKNEGLAQDLLKICFNLQEYDQELLAKGFREDKKNYLEKELPKLKDKLEDLKSRKFGKKKIG